MNNFRGHLVDVFIPAPSEPYFDGSDFSTREKVVPSSVQYKIDDLLAVGKVSPVSTEILHDSSAVEDLVKASEEPVVESSNNE